MHDKMIYPLPFENRLIYLISKLLRLLRRERNLENNIQGDGARNMFKNQWYLGKDPLYL